MTWADNVKAKRKALELTQAQLAEKIGITRQHLQRVESGKQNASVSLQEEIDLTLDNWINETELDLNIDYVRIRFPTHDVDWVLQNFLYLNKDYMLFDDWGFYGYEAHYTFSNIQVMIAPTNDKLGVLLELKGQGCREFEGILLAHNQTWFDFFRKCYEAKAIFKRIDLAVNDRVGMLNIPELIVKCQHNECVSVMRRFQGLNSGAMTDDGINGEGATLYIGSMKSDIYFCVYEKAAEQIFRYGEEFADTSIKNRFEIRLKNDRATVAIEDLLSYRNVERTAFGIITRYVRFVDPGKGEERSNWPTNQTWAAFCGKGRPPLRLTLKPEPFDLRKTRGWIKKQVAPMLKVLLKIDGYEGNNQTMTMIKSAELQQKHLKLLEQHTVTKDDVIGDYFTKEETD